MTPSVRWTASEALASRRLASRPVVPVLAPARRSGLDVARASQAPSSIADQSLAAPVKGTTTGPGARGRRRGRRRRRGVLEQREQPGVLEDAARRVDEHEVDVLLGGQPGEVGAGRDGGEHRGAGGRAAACSARRGRAPGARARRAPRHRRRSRRDHHLARAGQRLGQREPARRRSRGRARRRGSALPRRRLGGRPTVAAEGERRVLAQDRALELLQRVAGLDAELARRAASRGRAVGGSASACRPQR